MGWAGNQQKAVIEQLLAERQPTGVGNMPKCLRVVRVLDLCRLACFSGIVVFEGFPGGEGNTKPCKCGSRRSSRGSRDALPRTSERQMPSPFTGGCIGGGKVNSRNWGCRPENGTRSSLLCAPMSVGFREPETTSSSSSSRSDSYCVQPPFVC